jgi:hypothetical protein
LNPYEGTQENPDFDRQEGRDFESHHDVDYDRQGQGGVIPGTTWGPLGGGVGVTFLSVTQVSQQVLDTGRVR